MDGHIVAPARLNRVQVTGGKRIIQQRMPGLNAPIKDAHHRCVSSCVLNSRLQLTHPVMLFKCRQTRKERGYFVRTTQLSDVIDTPEGHGELLAGGADEYNRSVTESEVVIANREFVLPGVLCQPLVLSTVASSEP